MITKKQVSKELDQQRELARQHSLRAGQIQELKRLLAAEASQKRYIETIAKYAPSVSTPKLEVRNQNQAHKPEHIWNLILSDLHVGQATKNSETGKLFQQTTELSKAQMKLLWTKIESLFNIDKGQVFIPELNIFQLGDLVEGDGMRASQARGIDELVTKQTMDVVDIMAEFVGNALRIFNRVNVWNVGGNHDRTSPKPSYGGLGELGYCDTFAWLIAEFERRMFRNAIVGKRLTVNNFDSFFGTAVVANQRIVFEHGASFKTSSGCVDTKTEILSERGWLKYNELREGDKVATFDTYWGCMQWQPVLKINIFDHDGPMIKAGRKDSLDMLLTPNHRVVTTAVDQKTSQRRARVILAEDMKDRQRIPVSSKDWIQDHHLLTYDDGARLGWFLSEGYWRKRNDELGLCQSTITNPEFCNELETLFEDDDLYKKEIDNEGILRITFKPASFSFYECWAPHKNPNFLSLRWWSDDALKGCFRALLKGDGSSIRPRFTQKTGPIADFFQALAFRLGKRSNLIEQTTRPGMCVISYEDISVVDVGKIEMVDYNGIVWCPTVQAGTWVARRNGKPFITGNSYGGIGWYPIQAAAKNYVQMLNGADLVLMGHFHQGAMLPQGSGWQILNGALPPSTPFVQASFKRVIKPCQVLFELHKDFGVVDYRPIYLPHEGEAKPEDFWINRKQELDR